MRRTTIGIIALAGIVAATGAWQLFQRGSQPRETAKAATTLENTELAVSAPITKALIAIDAVVDNRSKAGAARAAARFLELDEQLFPSATPETARKLSDSITATAAQKRLGDRAALHQSEILAKGDLEGLTLRLAPISTRVRKYSTTSVTVDIFLLRLWSFPTKGALDDYATAEVNLVWENNGFIGNRRPVSRRTILGTAHAGFDGSTV